MKVIRIKYHTKDIEKIQKIEKGDWIDLRSAENVFIPHMEMKLVSLGVSIELPEGYEAHLLTRSSTFKNWGVIQTNSMGVIDEAYCGDNDVWKIPLFCINPKDSLDGVKGTLIKQNDRICQFRIMQNQEEIMFEEVEHLGNDTRGGFGSTGTS